MVCIIEFVIFWYNLYDDISELYFEYYELEEVDSMILFIVFNEICVK